MSKIVETGHTVQSSKTLKAAIAAMGGALLLLSAAGCYGPGGLTPRYTGALAGGALGAGGGYLVGSAVGAPATGALVGGVGGALGGYALGRQYERNYYGDYPSYPNYYPY